MKITAEYKGKQVTFDVPDETLDKLIEEPKKTGWKKPAKGWAWYIYAGKVHSATWNDTQLDNELYDCGNCFASKELADNIARYQSLDLRIRRRLAEICEPVGWNDSDQEMFEIVYDADRKHLDVYSSYTIRGAGWHCDTREHTEQIIEEFKDELEWYFTEFKDRMDG